MITEFKHNITVMALVYLVMLISLVFLHGQPTASWHYVPPRILRGSINTQTCPPAEDRERVRREISSDVWNLLASMAPPSPCGGHGWTHIAYLNMTDPAQTCPSSWTLFASGGKRVCFQSSSSGASCDSVFYNNPQQQGYSQVCGCIIGYQFGNPHGFYPYCSSGYSIDTYTLMGLVLPMDSHHGNTFGLLLPDILK